MSDMTLPTDIQLFTPKQIAERLGVSSRSVLRWIQNGKLEGQKLGPRQYRVNMEALEKFLKQSKESTRLEIEKTQQDEK